MSAEILHRAAALMRERAAAAASGPWAIDDWKPKGSWPRIMADSGESLTGKDILVAHAYYPGGRGESAEHIASWDPDVALAVADLLDHAAARAESKIEHGGWPEPVWSHERDALAVARAYLGGEATSCPA